MLPARAVVRRWSAAASRLRRGAVLTAAALAIAATTHHAVAERRAEQETQARIQSLLASLEALPTPAGHTTLHVAMNGVLTTVAVATEPLGLADAARAVADACGHDEQTGGADVVGGGDRSGPRYAREIVRRDDSADGSASAVLCVFRDVATGERRERLTIVKRAGDAASSSLTSITRDSDADLARMFPLDGDAPGDDLAGVPRPAASRRVFAATVHETGHAVRIYEPTDDANDVVASFDRQMGEQGFVSSPAVERAVTDARLYVRGSTRIVVSFERAEPSAGGRVSRVVLARANLL